MTIAPVAAAGTTLAVDSRATKTARDFEAVFVGQMTRMMMETAAPEEGSFGGGHGEAMFRGVLAEQLGGAITARGGLGLARTVLDQIVALQGGARVG